MAQSGIDADPTIVCATASESSEKQCRRFFSLRIKEHCLTENGQAVAQSGIDADPTIVCATASESSEKQWLRFFSLRIKEHCLTEDGQAVAHLSDCDEPIASGDVPHFDDFTRFNNISLLVQC